MPKNKTIDIILPNGEKHTITKQKHRELQAHSDDIFITDNRQTTPEALYQEELEKTREGTLTLSEIPTPVKSPVKLDTPEKKLTRAEKRMMKFGTLDKDTVQKSLSFGDNAEDIETITKDNVNRPKSNEEMCERIAKMLPSIGLTGVISSNYEYVSFSMDSQKTATHVIKILGGHYHIIESYGGTNPPHTGIRLCFSVNNIEYSIEVDHSSDPRYSKMTSLKEREDGCNRAGYYIRDYVGKVISTPLQYLANGLVSSLDLNYNDNFQEAKYLFEKLQELYSIIVSANKGETYQKDAGLITGGKRKTRKHRKLRKSKNKRKIHTRKGRKRKSTRKKVKRR
jgi:hypothetical protein